jgi:signal peptidase I
LREPKRPTVKSQHDPFTAKARDYDRRPALKSRGCGDRPDRYGHCHQTKHVRLLDPANLTRTGHRPIPPPMDDAPPATIAPAPVARSEGRDFIIFLVKLMIVVALVRSFVFAPFSIPSESMMPRLLVGDYLIVTKWPYGFSRYSLPWSAPLIPGRILATLPERGDVVVFKEPPHNKVDVIKRVIGLPGDTVRVKGGQLFINGSAVPKVRIADFVVPVSPNTRCLIPASDKVSTCRYARFRETLPGGRSYEVMDFGQGPADDTGDYRVPADHLFLMGDDRDDSADSRREAGGFGFVPVKNLVGRAQFTVFSTDGSANYLLPWTWFSAARWDRIGEGF